VRQPAEGRQIETQRRMAIPQKQENRSKRVSALSRKTQHKIQNPSGFLALPPLEDIKSPLLSLREKQKNYKKYGFCDWCRCGYHLHPRQFVLIAFTGWSSQSVSNHTITYHPNCRLIHISLSVYCFGIKLASLDIGFGFISAGVAVQYRNGRFSSTVSGRMRSFY
jgi:hypothetical protein